MPSVLRRPPDSPTILRPADTPPPLSLPLFASPVRAGFPSPADDYVCRTLDLNDYLIPHKEATFFARIRGNSMIGAGIFDGDLAVVNRSLNATHRSIVLAVVDGEFTCKRLDRRGGHVRLLAEHPDFPPIDFRDGQELQIWGVVTSVIHLFVP